MGRVKGSTEENMKVLGLKVEQDGYDRPNPCLARTALPGHREEAVERQKTAAER